MKRILVVSWFFPPINSSEGLVTYKLLKSSKLQYDVCMQANTDSWSYGIDDNFKEVPNVNKIYAKSTTLDAWMDEVVEYFLQNKDKYDIVMTRSMPPESHKIGMRIKEIKPSIKWIASFGDPIANNPFVLKVWNQVSPYAARGRGIRWALSVKRAIKHELWKKRYEDSRKPLKLEIELENKILNVCDYIIFNSSQQMDYMLSSHGDNIKKKALILPHSFDESLYPETECRDCKRDKIRIVYVGHLDDIRTPHPFLMALKELKKECKDVAERLEVLFYGNMSANEKVYLLDEELLDVVQIKKPVTYLESLQVMKEADWLLHIDANLQDVLDHNIFFAAKLADYIGAGKPIMGITMTEGPSADILRDLNTLIMSYSVDEIKSYLYLILYNHYAVTINQEVSEKYNAKTVANTFDQFISKIGEK